MRKRKVNFKRHKTENANRGVGLYAGKPLPFSIGFVTHERPVKKNKPRDIDPKEWFALVKENEQKQSKKKKKSSAPRRNLL